MDFPLLAGRTPPVRWIDKISGTKLWDIFSDIAKYMILLCVFEVFRTFWGIKSVPERLRKKKVSLFEAFFRPSRVLDQNMSLHPPPKGLS